MGMSCLLTTVFDDMRATIQAIWDAGLRDQVTILIGGGPVDQATADYVGRYVDEWGSEWEVLEPGVVGEVINPRLADWADLDGNLLITNDVFDGLKIVEGRIVLPDRPGIGVLEK